MLRDRRHLIGLMHSVSNSDFMAASRSLYFESTLGRESIGCALFGVILRDWIIVWEPSVVLESRRSLSGFRGGGGPGLLERLRGCSSILDALCSSAGWLAKRLGEGWSILTCLSALGSGTGKSSSSSGTSGSVVTPGTMLDG